MKAENKTWKEISAELGRSASTLKARFKQIKDEKADAVAERIKPKEEPKADDKKKNDSQGKKKDTTAQPKATKAASNVAQVGEPVVLDEDDTFSYDELRKLVRIYQDDHTDTWTRIASRFYDETERRIAAEVLKAKFRQVWPHG
jgi:hypothetical protein